MCLWIKSTKAISTIHTRIYTYCLGQNHETVFFVFNNETKPRKEKNKHKINVQNKLELAENTFHKFFFLATVLVAADLSICRGTAVTEGIRATCNGMPSKVA
jgi:hypothetical protein